MTIVVSIHQFRQHLAEYIEKARAGNTVILQDDKKKQEIIQLVGRKRFNPEAFGNALSTASGVLTDKVHPEWKTKKDVIDWVSQSRKTADRIF